jgi:hypothetical protein
MQAPPRHKNRRNGATPIAQKLRDNVWQRVLDGSGLEARVCNGSKSTAMSDLLGLPSSAAASKAMTSIPDLPLEVQRNIFGHVRPHIFHREEFGDLFTFGLSVLISLPSPGLPR